MIVYTDTRPWQEDFLPKPVVARRFPVKTFYLYWEKSGKLVAEKEFISLYQAKACWHPVQGQAIYSQEAGDLTLCYRS